jgi:hypothetical protein
VFLVQLTKRGVFDMYWALILDEGALVEARKHSIESVANLLREMVLNSSSFKLAF